MQSILNVVRKEWKDAIRDRRSIVSSMLFAVFGPVMIYLLLLSLAEELDTSEATQVAIVGAEFAPTMVSKLAEQRIEWTDYGSQDEAFADGASVVVELPSDFGDRYRDGVPVAVAVTANFKDGKAETSARRLADQINQYGQKVSYSRLVAAGVAPATVNAISASTYDLSLAGARASRISDSLIYVFLIAGFISGAFMAADSVAGERERHSLESLLSQPVKPLTLVTGKWITAGIISSVVSVTTIVVGALMLTQAPLEELGLRLFINPLSIIQGALVLIPLAFLAVAIQMLVAARARTYREAGTYAQFTLFIPIAVAGSVMIGSIDYGALGEILPITSQTMALKDVLLEGKSSITTMIVGVVSTLMAAGAIVWLTAQRLADERSL